MPDWIGGRQGPGLFLTLAHKALSRRKPHFPTLQCGFEPEWKKEGAFVCRTLLLCWKPLETHPEVQQLLLAFQAATGFGTDARWVLRFNLPAGSPIACQSNVSQSRERGTLLPIPRPTLEREIETIPP